MVKPKPGFLMIRLAVGLCGDAVEESNRAPGLAEVGDHGVGLLFEDWQPEVTELT